MCVLGGVSCVGMGCLVGEGLCVCVWGGGGGGVLKVCVGNGCVSRVGGGGTLVYLGLCHVHLGYLVCEPLYHSSPKPLFHQLSTLPPFCVRR